MNRFARVLLMLASLFCGAQVQAHKPSGSYLQLAITGAEVDGRWDIAVEDLDHALALDADGDGTLRWGELLEREDDIRAYVMSRLAAERGTERCTLQAGQLMLADLSDGPYVSLAINGQCTAATGRLTLRYGLLFDLDPQHRGLLQLRLETEPLTGVFAPDRRVLDFDPGLSSAASAFRQYFREGVFHIAIGLDHLLFLAGLLLPAVVWRERGRWITAPNLGNAMGGVIRIVTAFTIAHALTLTAASLGWLSLPTRLTESLVAATIVFAAINILHPMVRRRLWAVAFGFGLIHGAGYATQLGDLGLTAWTLTLALLGFNFGVEGTQVAVAAVFVPISFLLRRQPWYQWGVVAIGAVVVAALGGVWFVERAFNLRFGF